MFFFFFFCFFFVVVVVLFLFFVVFLLFFLYVAMINGSLHKSCQSSPGFKTGHAPGDDFYIDQ